MHLAWWPYFLTTPWCHRYDDSCLLQREYLWATGATFSSSVESYLDDARMSYNLFHFSQRTWSIFALCLLKIFFLSLCVFLWRCMMQAWQVSKSHAEQTIPNSVLWNSWTLVPLNCSILTVKKLHPRQSLGGDCLQRGQFVICMPSKSMWIFSLDAFYVDVHHINKKASLFYYQVTADEKHHYLFMNDFSQWLWQNCLLPVEWHAFSTRWKDLMSRK